MIGNRVTVAFYTLGCKLNQTETAMMQQDFEAHGFEVVDWQRGADVSVLNTCTVTGRSASKCRHVIRNFQKINPDSIVVVTGCYAQVDAEEIEALGGVDYILGVDEKINLFEYVPFFEKQNTPVILKSQIDKITRFNEHQSAVFPNQTRAFLKIQDGCNNHCAYCIVTHARGPSRSLSVESSLQQVRELIQKGFREIVLTGVHIGAYGQEWSGQSQLSRLVEQMIRLDSQTRFRLSSLDPEDITSNIVQIMKNEAQFCSHFHIPIQSGCGKTLHEMYRKYTIDELSEKIDCITSNVNPVGLGADVIVGFPGETDEDFQATCDFIQSRPFTYLHVFPYSKRKGTPAAERKDQIPSHIKAERARLLRELAAKKKQEFYNTFTGKSVHVLFEDRNQSGKMSGFSAEYVRVESMYDSEMINRIVPVVVESTSKDVVKGAVQID